MNLSSYFVCYYSALVMIIMGIMAFVRFKKMNKITKRTIAISLGLSLLGCGLIISIRVHTYLGAV